MQILSEDNPYVKVLMSLIVSISREIHLDKEDQILIAMELNSEEKIKQFRDWIESKMMEDNLNAEPVEIVRAAVRIGEGKPT